MNSCLRLILAFLIAPLSAYPSLYLTAITLNYNDFQKGVELHGLFGFGLNPYLFFVIYVSMIVLALPTYILFRIFNKHYALVLVGFGPLYGALVMYIFGMSGFSLSQMIEGAIIGLSVSFATVLIAPTKKPNESIET
jgi:hypothetical protein